MAKKSLIETKNDLSAKTRQTVVELLNANLASAIDLSLQAKHAHWNVRGPHFFSLHELFDKVYEESVEWVDLIAERAVQLGGTAQGTLAHVTERTALPAAKTPRTPSGSAYVHATADALAAFAKSVRAAIAAADAAGDADTADLFTEVSRGADKMLWMVEAHLQGSR